VHIYGAGIENDCNDQLANLLVCLPIFNTVEGYRVPHFDHHRHSGTPRDPYAPLYAGYGSQARLTRLLFGDLFLTGSIAKFADRYWHAGPQPRASLDLRSTVALAAVQAALFVLCAVVTGRWYGYVVLWMLPLMTLPQFINRLRTIAEHSRQQGDGHVNRSTVAGWVEYLLIAPYGYSYHFEHHLAPNVPYYHLETAHRLLLDRGFEFTPQELTDGYVRTFARLFRSMDFKA
jgi:fatty acid desaturase